MELVKLKLVISKLLLVTMLMTLVSCAPYSKSELICKYDDFNCVYYNKISYDTYKYSDYFYDDVSNGEYIIGTPSLSDFKLSEGLLDYDIEGFVIARRDYFIKQELISKNPEKAVEYASEVNNGYYRQKKSRIYYYDNATKKSYLLYDGDVVNIAYDDEMPIIYFDVENIKEKDEISSIKGRKLKLSDVIASNLTLENAIKVLLATGNEKMKFFMEKRIDNDPYYSATPSELYK